MGCTVTPIKNFARISLIAFGLFVVSVKPDEDQDASRLATCELNLAQLLLLLPQNSIQVQALKRQLLRYVENKLDDEEYTKRSYSSLVRDGNLPFWPKRNVAALARAGYLKQPSTDVSDTENYKRSIANLAKNGQLPTFQKSDDAETKRGIESLARNGELLHGKREIENLLGELYEKRNIGALARGFNFPVAGKRYIGALARTGDMQYNMDDDDDLYDKRNIASIVRNNGKRSMASLVRSNNLPNGKRYIFDDLKRNIASIARTMGPRYNEKRAVPTAALLRQDNYMKGGIGIDSRHYDDEMTKSENDNIGENDTIDKRNIAALKAQMKPKYKRSVNENETRTSRNKRQADYWEPTEEYPVPVYQNNNVYDYEELMHELTGEYPNTEKRFLGSVAKTGWFRSPSSSSSRYHSPTKRHIGSLARLGWLPALRTARRFHRSGRSANDQQVQDYTDDDDDTDSIRSDTADGTSEDDATFTEEPLVGSKRYLLLPAVDNILFRRLYSNRQSPNQETL